MLNPSLYNIHLSQKEYQRYSKHFILDQIGLQGQKRLKQAKILVIGAGGLGCPAMLYLISTGIGTIGIVDEDYIDISNLNRQILYDITNIKYQKNHVAKNKLSIINPNCNVITYTTKLNRNNALEIIKNYDVIIDCTDNFQARYIIDTTCYNLHKIHIYGAVDKFEGQMSVFNYKNKLRYSDIYKYYNTHNIEYGNCNNTGILSSITGIIGILQATEAIKIILGIGQIISGKLLTYNLLNCQMKIVPIYKYNITNKIRYYKNFISNIDYKIYKKSFSKHINHIIIIDIRETYEFKNKHLQYSLNIPLKYLYKNRTINFIKKYFTNKIILIYCTSKARSITCYNILKQNMIKSMIIN
uniref:Molybdopterin biosynthesis protein n=1 Tax=Callithamnion tetricum TaxID=193179 RepID=A0A4D6WQA2_9FLOR|nr:Molybdopterin biosynthesis protein [Callithamnion tetricum]